jgi:3-hydroxyisobutyrate dehydrogenase
MAEKKTIAVVGLGSMGAGMAASLVRAGHAVRGYDPRPEPRRALADAGGHSAESPAQAAEGADIAVVVVVNAAQTASVLSGDASLVPGLAPGAVVIACPTMAPADAKRFAALVESQGARYLDAPISGGAVKAGAGQLTVMASGSREAFAAARPALDAMAATVYELGEEPGTGSAFKIVNQLLAGVHIAAACEAVAFASRLGLDLAKVYEVITHSAGNSWMFENRVPHVVEGDYSPRSATSIFTKDLGIVGDIARAHSFPLPMSASALQLFLMTEAAGMGRDDDASVARLFARIASLDLPGTGDA